MRGLFITLYGINNIGKSTQVHYLLQRLEQAGIHATSIKYPRYNLEPTGPQLNAILRSQKPQSMSEEELQAIFKQNRQDFEPTLEQLLQQYQVVVAEDYTGTGIAWGTAKGLSQNWLEKLNQNLLQEDYAFLLRGKRSIRAREAKHIHETNDLLVEKVGTILEQLAQQKKWKIIDIQPQPEQTAELLWNQVKLLLSRHDKS